MFTSSGKLNDTEKPPVMRRKPKPICPPYTKSPLKTIGTVRAASVQDVGRKAGGYALQSRHR